MSTQQVWTKEMAAAWLEKLPAAEPAARISDKSRKEFLKKFAVLVRFRIYEESLHEDLRKELARLPALPEEEPWFTLQPEARKDGLRLLGSKDAMWQARQSSSVDTPTLLQTVFDQYLQGDYEAVESLDILTLEAALRITEWLRPFVKSLPSTEHLKRKLARRRLLQPMEHATMHFIGREEQLTRLRGFVDVLDSQSYFESAVRGMRSYTGRGALMVYGIGGCGKTTLLNEFIRQHVNSEAPFPWAYLDFDDPRLNVASLDTLVFEIASQLEAQYSETDWQDIRLQARRLAQQNAASTYDSSEDRHTLTLRDVESAEAIRSRNATRLGEALAEQLRLTLWASSQFVRSVGVEVDQPFLLILDTFEEVQKRGIRKARALWQFLKTLQEMLPQLRVVVSGRVQVPEMAQFSRTEAIALQGFDRRVAMAYLERMGVENAATATALFKQVGGNPLSLRLASQVAKLEEVGPEGIRGLRTKSYFMFAAEEHVVQGQLYQRILGRITHEDVRKLAHPGLAVRKITPGLIRSVLAVPCGLGEIDEPTAERLFEELEAQVDLVTRESDGALRHQQDIRRVMLKLLASEQPERTRKIHEGAFAYFTANRGRDFELEAAYHALQLEKPEGELYSLLNPEIADTLLGSVDEFPVISQLLLYEVTRQEPPEELRAQAGLEQWEKFAEAQARAALQYGETGPAMAIVAERSDRSAGSGLYAVSALCALHLGELKAARAVLEEGIASAQSVNRIDRLVELYRLWADLLQREQNPAEADATLHTAIQLAMRLGQPFLALQIVAERARIYDPPSLNRLLPVDLLQDLEGALKECPDSDIKTTLVPLQGIFRVCGPASLPLLRRGLGIFPLYEAPASEFVTDRGTFSERGAMANVLWEKALQKSSEDISLRMSLAVALERAIDPHVAEVA